jgi:hypothetical protein
MGKVLDIYSMTSAMLTPRPIASLTMIVEAICLMLWKMKSSTPLSARIFRATGVAQALSMVPCRRRNGKGLAATHRCTPHDVAWYANSPGKQGLMRLGDCPASDGATFGSDENPTLFEASGLSFNWLIGTSVEAAARRPSADQIRTIVAMMKGLGNRFAGLPSKPGEHRHGSPRSSGLKEGQQIAVDPVLVGRAHTMRRALVDF